MAVQDDPSFRLQIFDDGAGEYVFDVPLSYLLGAGSMNTNTALVGGAIGPFILPSPLAVCKPGLLTVSLSNDSLPQPGAVPPETPAEQTSVVAHVALVFAVPKKCRGASTAFGRQQDRRGLMNL
jgi:hypothetical protein